MSDIAIHNETAYDLTPLILRDITSDAIEHFGELIHTIRVQDGIDRHVFNTKTQEVRYAFYPSDYECVDPMTFSNLDDTRSLLLALDNADEDENLLAEIDDNLDTIDSDDDIKFDGFHPDYASIEAADPESSYEDDEVLESSQS